jgi:SET domain
LGYIPLYNDVQKADRLLKQFLDLRHLTENNQSKAEGDCDGTGNVHGQGPNYPSPQGNQSDSNQTCETHENLPAEGIKLIDVSSAAAAAAAASRNIPSVVEGSNNAWYTDLFGLVTSFATDWESTVLSALPSDTSSAEQITTEYGSLEKAQHHSSRHTMEWLQEHGTCADHLRPGVSAIPHAGRGAFAVRPLSKDAVVAPLPLIHIPDSQVLTQYAPQHFHDRSGTPDGPRNISAPIHSQLMMNYCMGHPDSTLLLCPYGVNTALVNHDHVKPNVELRWSTRHTSHIDWLHQPIEEWAPTSTAAGLVMELVALRDIAEGEEILMDYGEEWERAWQDHVSHWQPPAGANEYQPAKTLERQQVIRTTETDGYYYDSKTVAMLCRYSLLQMYGVRLGFLEDENESESKSKDDDQYAHCRAIKRYPASAKKRMPTNHKGDYSNEYLYTIEVYAQAYDQREKKCVEQPLARLWNVPRDMFAYEDVWYSRDHAQPWSFRQPMGIPEHLMPKEWKNKLRAVF